MRKPKQKDLSGVRTLPAPTDALRDTLLAITKIPSPIGEEKALCDHIVARFAGSLGGAKIIRFRNSLVVRANERPDAPKIALVGHLDTVRTHHDGPVRIEGDRLYGAGAADMKSGLAVMIELAERESSAALPVDLTLIFYEREEGPFDENVLGPMLAEIPFLSTFDLAICLEPSDCKLQLGCMGSLHSEVSFLGKTAHSARPWQGDNAITKSATLLAALGARPPEKKMVDGFEFQEVVTATLATGGRGRNVVPDKFTLNLNYRFAPGRTPEEAHRALDAWVREHAGTKDVETRPLDLSPAGRPHATHPLVQRLAACGVEAIEVKQAWTDVARFDTAGVVAVNFGPGTQAQAHQRNEYTDLPSLDVAYGILLRFLRQFSA